MRSVRIEVENVTPLLSGGGDPESEGLTDGLRPSSLKGLLRWWYRALVGCKFVDQFNRYKTLEPLYDYESELFGSTKSKSVVRIKVTPSLPLKERKLGEEFGYFLFPMHRKRKKKDKEGTEVELLSEGNRFRVEFIVSDSLRTREVLSDKEREAELWLSVLLMFLLGNVGSRARRGFGSLDIVKIEGFPEISLGGVALKGDDLKRLRYDYDGFLHEKLFPMLKGYTESCSIKYDPWSFFPYPILHPKAFRVYRHKDSFLNWRDALYEAERMFKEYKKGSGDFKKLKGLVNGVKKMNGRDLDLKTFSFGLPQQFYKKGDISMFLSLASEFDPQRMRAGRRASPVFVKVVRRRERGNGERYKYVLYFMLFKSMFSPDFILGESKVSLKVRVDKNIYFSSSWNEAKAFLEGFFEENKEDGKLEEIKWQ